MKIIYKPTVLNISAGVYLAILLVYTIVEWKMLSHGEGWGVVAMAGLAFIGALAWLADFILQQVFRNKWVLNIIGVIIIVGLAIFILKDF